MSTPQFVRGNYSDLFSSSQLPVLEALFRWELTQYDSKREKLFNTRKTDRDIYQTSELADLPLFSSIPEGTDYTYSTVRQGASKTITVTKYGMGFSISEEAVDDGKFDHIADMVKKLAKSGKESQEIAAMNILNNAFGSTTVADGLALCHTAHTLPSGSTFRNRMSTDADLSETALQTCLTDFETQFVGDTGIIYSIKPKYLIVAPANKRYAMELLGSDGKPDSADNNLNSLKSDSLEVVCSPHLTDSDAFFLSAEKSQTGLDIISRKGIQTKAAGPDAGFDNDSIKYKSSYREKVDAVHAYGFYGSSGLT